MMRKRFTVVLTLCLVLIFGLCFFSYLSADTESHLDGRKTVCLKEYPTDPSLFKELVQPYVTKIIDRHGLEEWKAVLLTNELHRHLGMWSIVGAKMGVRAREVLEAPFDMLDVISFSGFKPPFSCLNDGIQVSTGASLGRGTITNTHLGRPAAIFFYKDKKVTMRVKPEIMKTIRGVIKEYSKKYVFQSPRYFQELDKISLEYWLKWDRKKMFEEIRN